MKTQKVRQQTRIKGIKRIPTTSSQHPIIRKKLESESHRFRVSKSWIIACALAKWFRIEHVIDTYLE